MKLNSRVWNAHRGAVLLSIVLVVLVGCTSPKSKESKKSNQLTEDSKLKLTNPLIVEPGMSDPHMLVVDDVCYVFTGHDIGFGIEDWVMPDWRIYRSEDMQSWEHVGTISPEDNYMGAGNTSCWAGDIVERNGNYYWYFSNHHDNAGVMVADKPEGPYKDAIGKPLVDSFDPTIFVDDDNTPYIIYGRTNYQIARLKESMIELDEEPKTIVINKPTYFPDMDKNSVHKYNLLLNLLGILRYFHKPLRTLRSTGMCGRRLGVGHSLWSW